MNRRMLNIVLITLSVLLLAGCFLSGDAVKWLEIYGTSFGLIQAVLIMVNKKENWIFYNSYIIAFLLLSWIFRLYGDVVENTVYLFMGAMGAFLWYKKSNTESESLPSYMSVRERIICGVMLVSLSVVMYMALSQTDDPFPLLDGITTAMGLTATFFMAKKRVEAWIIWFVDDILMAIIYFMIPEQPIYLLWLNIIWTVLALGSWYKWHKLSKQSCVAEREIELIPADDLDIQQKEPLELYEDLNGEDNK